MTSQITPITTMEDANSSINAALKETQVKVVSSLLPSVESYVENESFNYSTDGLDFYEVKTSVMLSYLIDLANLIRLQTEKQIQEQNTSDKYVTVDYDEEIQSCLHRLHEMKIIIDKTRPMEKRLRYQIDKLLAYVPNDSSVSLSLNQQQDGDEDADESDDDNLGSDPLSFRPDPEALMASDDEGSSQTDSARSDEDGSDHGSENNEDEDEDDDEEIQAARETLKLSKKSSKTNTMNDDENNKIYKVPKLSAMHFNEKEKQDEKEKRILEKQRNRMRKSELLSTLKSSFGDAPEEDDYTGGANIGKQRESARRLAEYDKERTKFEEDAFVRLTTSRKEKKLRNKIMRDEISNLNTIADLSNLTAGVSTAFGDNNSKRSSKKDGGFDVEKGQGTRYSNGKRVRGNADEGSGGKKSNKNSANGKNVYQKALFGMEGGSKKKKSKK